MAEVPAAAAAAASPARRRWSRLWPLVFLLLGTLTVFWPMLVSGFELTHGGLGDGRLVNYSLEHTYLWLLQEPLHRNLWDVPLFHPQSGVAAYTDMMLGIAPLYWLWRGVGFAADTAFQLWLLTVFVLNYWLAHHLLRRGFGLGGFGAAAGAYLIAFGHALLSRWYHPQLLPLPLVLLGFIAVARVLKRPARGSRARAGWIGVFGACCVLQAWSAWYLFFFYGLLLILAVAWAALFADTRGRLRELVGGHWRALLVTLVLCGLALAPLVRQYLITAEEVGPRKYQVEKVPQPAAWLLPGTNHLLWGWLQQRDGPFHHLDSPNQSNGIGVLTLLAAVIGLAGARRHAGVRVLALATGTLLLLATAFGEFSLWRWVQAAVPGADAIRAIGRIGMLQAIPAGIGIGWCGDRLLAARRPALLALAGVVCFAEQQQFLRWVPKQLVRDQVARVVARVDARCESFLLVCENRSPYDNVSEDAAWAGLELGIPTVNGRYGNRPRGYRLGALQDCWEGDKEEVRRRLRRWMRLEGLAPGSVCWVEYRGRRVPATRNWPLRWRR